MNKPLNKIICSILIFVFSVSTLFCGYMVYKEFIISRISIKVYEDLKSYVSVPTEIYDETDISKDTLKDCPNINFTELETINSDVVAWINIKNSEINYPVVQGTNNNYYLNHLIDGKENRAGCIFLDYRANISERHSIIYGHNMKNGTMFADLTKYKKQSYYDGHKEGLLITPEHTYVIQFFAGYVANLEDFAWKIDFLSDEEFSIWLKNIKGKSSFLSDITPRITDRIITLSTCSYEFENARYVLHGLLVKK